MRSVDSVRIYSWEQLDDQLPQATIISGIYLKTNDWFVVIPRVSAKLRLNYHHQILYAMI